MHVYNETLQTGLPLYKNHLYTEHHLSGPKSSIFLY